MVLKDLRNMLKRMGKFAEKDGLKLENGAWSGSEALLQRIIDHVKASCVWLKKDAERKEIRHTHLSE